MTDTLASKTLERFEAMKRTKQPWRPTQERLSEYVFQRAMTMNTRVGGAFLNGYIFDDTAPWAARTAAALLKANLFPSAQKTIKIRPHRKINPKILEKKENKDWFDFFHDETVAEFSHPRSGFDLAGDEYCLAALVYGTAGLGVWEREDGAESDCYFTSTNTNNLYIDEGADGFVDTVFIHKTMTVKQVVQQYGEYNCSMDTQKRFSKNDLQHEVQVLHAIEPRMNRKWSFGDMDFPVASVHIEIQAKHILQESGYQELPVNIGRFYKDVNTTDPYGYSPLIDCMPSILEINHARECLIRAASKSLRPPLAVTEDGLSTHSKIDISDGALNVKKLNGRIESANFKWIEPLFTIGDMKPAKDRILEIVDQITRACFLDRLLDFNSDQRMTLGEVNVRERRTGQSMLPIFQRQTAEVWTPTVHRVVKIKWRRNRYGYMPGSIEAEVMKQMYGVDNVRMIPPDIAKIIAAGGDVYEVEYISPASRMERSEELLGMQQLAALMSEAAKAGLPQVANGLSWYDFLAILCELTGSPGKILLSEQEAKESEAAANQAAMQQSQVNLQHIAAQANRANAQADAERAKAGSMAAPADAGLVPPTPMQQGVT